MALKQTIHELVQRKRAPISILDIGIGDARIPKHLSGIKELWDKISHYTGIDVSQNCIDLSRRVIADNHIADKVTTTLLNATQLQELHQEYDLIICTWFTAGNFYPSDFSFETFSHGQDLSRNSKFEEIFSQAYTMLLPQGQIIIGSMYLDNARARAIQEESYRYFGWTVITNELDSFTASKEGWWSQRFTRERVFNYLHFIPQHQISFVPLDTYDFAMMVQIRKTQ